MSIKLPAIINSGMVIEKEGRIWGFANDVDVVTVEFEGEIYTTNVVDKKWEVKIKVDSYGGPYSMKINEIILDDIYVGKVFCACGQSNMELPINRVKIKYEKELKNLLNKKLRIFTVEKNHNFMEPKELFTGKWDFVCDENIENFFATSYFFAKKYQEYENIPIGIINTAAGGSKIESWLKEDDVKKYPKEYKLLKNCQENDYVNKTIKFDENRRSNWHLELNKKDIGFKEKFIEYDYSYKNWNTRELTEEFHGDLTNFSGSVWFKKSFYLEEVQDATLFLGTLIDADKTYINGVEVGETAYQYPPRIYKVPKEVLKLGENQITIRMIVYNNKGGFTKGKDYKIKLYNDEELNLDGQWYYGIGSEMKDLQPETFFFMYPTGYYNSMLYPILKYTLSGFLWYQGESNTSNPYNYDELLGVLLQEIYRWQGEGLPFALVQLPNFDAKEDNEKWEILREKQKTILNYKNCGLVVTLGFGEDNDLHPLNKKDVGEGLANCIYSIINHNCEPYKNVFVNRG